MIAGQIRYELILGIILLAYYYEFYPYRVFFAMTFIKFFPWEFFVTTGYQDKILTQKSDYVDDTYNVKEVFSSFISYYT